MKNGDAVPMGASDAYDYEETFRSEIVDCLKKIARGEQIDLLPTPTEPKKVREYVAQRVADRLPDNTTKLSEKELEDIYSRASDSVYEHLRGDELIRLCDAVH